MTTKQFNEAVQLSDSYPAADTVCFDGFGLPDFQAVYVTLAQVAALINWQAKRFDGTFDQEALQEVKHFSKNRFLIREDA